MRECGRVCVCVSVVCVCVCVCVKGTLSITRNRVVGPLNASRVFNLHCDGLGLALGLALGLG